MIILNSNSKKEELDRYIESVLKININELSPNQIIYKILLYYGVPINYDYIDNKFLIDLADNILKKMDKSKKQDISPGKKIIEKILDIKSSQFYTLKLKFDDTLYSLLIKQNNKYNYTDIFIIDPYKSTDYCGHCRFINELSYYKYNRAYIYWIKTKDPYSYSCGIKNITGNNVLNLFITFSKILNIKIIELEESAYRYCITERNKDNYEYTKYYTSIYDWLTVGKTWYERKGFISSPEKSIRDYSRYMSPPSKIKLLSMKTNSGFFIEYQKHIKFLQKIKVKSLLKIYQSILTNFNNYINNSDNNKIKKKYMIDFSFCAYYMKSFLNNKKIQYTLQNFVIWLYKQDCYLYTIFINTIIIYANMWSIDNNNNPKSIHYYNNRYIKDRLVNDIATSFTFLTQRNYFYLIINNEV